MKTFMGKRMSKAFKIEVHEYEDHPDIYTVKGSPADIRKIIGIAEKNGFVNFYCKPVTMREGRLYEIMFEDGSSYYSVSRVA